MFIVDPTSGNGSFAFFCLVLILELFVHASFFVEVDFRFMVGWLVQ